MCERCDGLLDEVERELCKWLGPQHNARMGVQRLREGRMDLASEQRLALVKPELARVIRAMAATLLAGTPSIEVRVTQGLRNLDEQNYLYAQGRTRPGGVVTNARGGYSMHNFGLAVDLCPGKMDGQPWSPDWQGADQHYALMVQAGMRAGLNCGANWHTLKDEPHFQVALPLPATPTDAMRADLGNGSMQWLKVVWAKVDAGVYK